MSARKTGLKLGMAAVAMTGLALSALAPANAVDGPTPFVQPTLGTDIIGVGSDTTQFLLDALATTYDATATGPKLINYDACLGSTDPNHSTGLGDNPDGSGFPCGQDNTGTKAGVARFESVVTGNSADNGALPNGSGAARTLLRTPSDKLFNDVAFARSSGPMSVADVNAGLIALPFAVDKIVPAVSPDGPAPAAITGPQLLKIFNGTYTNWDQVGGKNAPIHPYLPKNGSGTQQVSFVFLASLDGVTEAPGADNDPSSHSAAKQTWQGPGTAITDANWNTGTTNVEEHDPSIIEADPDAIELFSYARAQLGNKTAQTTRLLGGWSEDRELYNVVRGKAITGATTTPFVYGSTGTATDTDPNGILESLFGPTGFLCTNTAAATDINNLGEWPINSSFCGKSNTNTLDSIDPHKSSGIGEGQSTTTSAFISGENVAVAVSAADGTTIPTGSVQVTLATPTAPGQPAPAASYSTTKALDANGQAIITVPSTVTGSKIVDVSYLPTNFGAQNSAGGHDALGSSYTEVSGTFKAPVVTPPVVKKVNVTLKATKFAKTTKKGKQVTGTVTAKQASGSVKPTGTIEVKLGSKVLQKITLKAGVAKVKFAATKLKAKKSNTLKFVYLPKGNFLAHGTATVKIKRTK